MLVVDLAALARNYRKLRAASAPAQCAAVVKSNAYGLGMQEVASALHAEGCRTFFVATLAEAQVLRSRLADITIYVLNGLPPRSADEFARLDVRPVLGSMREIEEWKAFCRSSSTPCRAAVHVDTGMNRHGIKGSDCVLLCEPPPGSGLSTPLTRSFPISLVMSHLACADEPDNPKNAAQREAFVALSAGIPAMGRSLANSAGIFLGRDYHFDLVRPGIALYGGNPFAGQPNPMELVAHLYGRIVAIGEASAGETFGYGGSRRVTRRTRYVTVSAGYADGYFRALGSSDGREGADAYFGGWRLPILGRVSMDLSVFDATDVPEGRLQAGDFLELLGARFTVDDAASLAGTIGYEMLTSLGPRYHRIYIVPENRD